MPELQASQYSGLYTLVLYVLPPATGTGTKRKRESVSVQIEANKERLQLKGLLEIAST